MMWSEWGVVTPKRCMYMYMYMHLVHTCAYNQTPTPHPPVHNLLKSMYRKITTCEGGGEGLVFMFTFRGTGAIGGGS